MGGAEVRDPVDRALALVSGATMSARAKVLLAAAVLLVLYLSSLVSYLLFHTAAEAIFAMVSVAVLVVAWNLREFLDDDFPLFVGMALVSVGFLRAVHTLEFEGMGVLESVDADHATQLWIAAGYLAAVSLVVAPELIGRRVSAGAVAGVYAAIVGAVLAAVYVWKVFPVAYAADGLTPFKKVSEYVIAATILGSLALLLRKRRRLAPATVTLLTAALVLWAVSELAFTFYVDVRGTANLVGHLLSVLSAYLIYSAVVEAGLARPHALAIADLRSREREALVAQDRAEAVRGAFDQLLELTPRFHSDGGYDDIARLVCTSARRLFDAQWAALLAVDGEDVIVLAREPEAALMARGVRFPIALEPGLREDLESRTPGFVADGSLGLLVPPGEERRTRRRSQPVLRVPVGAGEGGGRAKVLVLSWREERPEPDPMSIALAQRFADQVSVALAQAGRREAQDRAARLHQRLEASLLPSLPVDVPGLRVATWYRPGEQRLYLGGDFIDMAPLEDGRLALIVGDVSGHGPDAAALGATLRAGWQTLTLCGVGPHETIETLARVLRRESPSYEMFVTLCAAWIDPRRGELQVLSMGHPPPLIVADEVHEADARPYPPLGVLEDVRWEPSVVALPDGWTLVFFTDGLVEGRAAPATDERFGVERLQGLFAREFAAGPADLDAALERVVMAIVTANGGPLPDDVALVVVTSRPGVPAPGPV